MITLRILMPDGTITERELTEEVALIGRAPSNEIVLADKGVSRKHARIERRNGHLRIVDEQSTAGTFVNGQRVTEADLNHLDQVRIGGVTFTIVNPDAATAAQAAAGDGVLGTHVVSPRTAKEKAPAPETLRTAPAEGAAKAAPSTGAPGAPAAPAPPRAAGRGAPPEPEAPPSSAEDEEFFRLKQKMHRLLIDKMDLRKINIEEMNEEALRKQTDFKIREVIVEMGGEIPPRIDRNRLLKEMLDDSLGLGPLEPLLDDEKCTEIMVNSKDQIYIEYAGKLSRSPARFLSEEQVYAVIQRIVAPLGRRIDESSPMVDARLADGSRVNAIIPPLALRGPSITIRKFSKRRLLVEDLYKFGTITAPMAELMGIAVRERMNIVISGGTGSGKTTLLNIISSFIPDDERIVTVEDAAELKLPQEHVVSLESRPPNVEGKGAVTIRDLVKNCLRMRPDRIVVGECRSGEALDMLQAMNTGHDGSLTTLHANTPRDALARLSTMVLMSGMDLPLRAIKEQIASAINLIVQQSRMKDGSRKITHITEVTGMEGEVITLQDIYLYEQTGFDANGKVVGRHKATGAVPKFIEELRQRGISVDMSIFDDNA